MKFHKKEMPIAFYIAEMYLCLSSPQTSWYSGAQDFSDNMDNKGDPGSPSLEQTPVHSDLSLLLSGQVFGQRGACEGAPAGLEMFCSREGTHQSTLCFSIPWSSQRAAGEQEYHRNYRNTIGSCRGHRNITGRVKNLLNCNYLKLLRQKSCGVAVAFKVQVVRVTSC